MTLRKLILYSSLLITVTGCAPKTRYVWNNYDDKLYQHYKNPAEYDRFIEHLKEVIEDGEESGKVPPGIYAEYGFALYEKGSYLEAADYFKRENDKWPESRALMTKMIQNAKLRDKQGKQPDQAAAPAGIEASSAGASEVKGGTQ